MLPSDAQLQCEFVVDGCLHNQGQLFSSSFARSNRTRATKILRCFPHCCPAHRDRSYCGMPLHVRVHVPALQSSIGNNVNGSSIKQSLGPVTVYGRFEREEVDPKSDPVEQLQLGQQVPSSSITSSKQQNPWIQAQAESVANAKGPSDQVFAFQNNEQCHWEYDYNSGTSQRQRARTHVFRAYVFLPVAAPAPAMTTPQKTKSRAKKKTRAAISKEVMWQVVGITTSTPFTISAYRKPTEPKQQASVVICTQRREDIQIDNDSDETETDPGLEGLSETTAASHLLLPSDFRKLLWEKHNPVVVKATTSLSIFALFMSQIQLKWLSPYTLSRSLLPLLRFWRTPGSGQPAMSQNVYGCALANGDRSNSNGNDQERLLLHYINYCAPLLVAVLSPNEMDTRHDHSYSSRYKASSDGGESDEASDLDQSAAQLSSLAEQCFDLVCSLLENDQWSHLEHFVRDEACSTEVLSDEDSDQEDSSEKSDTAVYARFVSLLTHLLNECLAKDVTKLGLLVDNIVSSVYRDRKASEPVSFAPFVVEKIVSLLRNTNTLGMELFQAQVRVVESSQVHQNFFVDAHRSLKFLPPSEFTGRWVCRTIEASQQHSTAKAFDFHALPVILTLLRTFGFDLELLERSDLDDSVTQMLAVHSLVSLFPEVGTCFTLDNEPHSLDRLPCGMSVEWLLQLMHAGEPLTCSSERRAEYRGSMAPSDSNGTIHLDVYLYSGAGDGVRVSFDIQLLQLKHQQKRSFGLQRKYQVLSSHATRTRLQVQVTLLKGTCDRHDIDGDVTHKRSPQERIERIQDWDEQLGFTATYDRHFSGSVMENAADRMARTQTPTAFTISREEEGSGELSAIV